MTGAELREWRLSRINASTGKPLTQADAAKLVNASRYQLWQKWEAGRARVPPMLPGFLKMLDLYFLQDHEDRILAVDAIAATIHEPREQAEP